MDTIELWRDGGVSELRLLDAAKKNALTPAFVEALQVALTEVREDPEVKVLLLSGLPEVFSSGADRETLMALVEGRTKPTDILLPKAVLDLPVPVIAAMEGHAVGGGLALGLCADIVYLARESRYGCSFMSLGFTPGMGMTRLFEHVLSPAMAHELLYSAELRAGREFQGRAGVNHILPRAEVLPAARALAARIAEKPRKALELLKRQLSLPRRRAFEASRTAETSMHEVSFAQPELKRWIEEFYVE